MRRVSILLLLCALLAGADSIVVVARQGDAASTPNPAAAPQPAAAPAPAKTPRPPVSVEARPIRVDVLIQRKKGNQIVSSLPYSLLGETGNGASDNGLSLRLGSMVPIQTGGASTSNGPTPAVVVPLSYQNVGTNIDCFVRADADGRYHVRFILDDSSVADADADASGAGGATGAVMTPVIRSYRITTNVVAKDGERQQVNVATDKVSGETVVAEITVTGL
jgi:hypothetical protein